MRMLWSRRVLQICFLILAIFCGSIFLVSAIYMNKTPEPIPDTYPPIIELFGGAEIKIPVNSEYSEPGYDAYDIGGDFELTIDGSVDSNTIGDYTIVYKAIDNSGNETSVSRVVHVMQPTGYIYLTFDDGPSEHTGRLLDVLNKYNVKVTFFVTGYGDDALIKREYDEGHSIALHTNTHNYSYIYSSVDNYFADLSAVSERVRRITGFESKLLRFPGGSSNLVSRRYDGHQRIMSKLVSEVTARGYTFFDWNVDSNDAGGAASSDEVYNNVISRLKVGGDSVVLQHDVKGFSVDAVERIIQYSIENNYVFKKLDSTSFDAHHGVNN